MKGEDQIKNEMRQYERFASEFVAESDRGCAVLILCVLEQSLHRMFESLIVEEDADLRTLAPPGNLRIAIRNAELLGLLTPQQAACFLDLSKIRNDFAHKVLEGLTFDSVDIAQKVRSLTWPAPMGNMKTLQLQSNRNQFFFAAATLQMVMSFSRPHVERLQNFGEIAVGGRAKTL